VERITPEGEVLVPLDEDQAREELELLARCEVAGVAVCLLHAWLNPVHEQRLRELVAEVLGDVPCSISSEVSPLAREYPRASTTVVDLLMKLKYSEYTTRLEAGLEELGFQGAFNYADCAARLMPASYAMERPYRLVVGGPAAGTVATAHFGAATGRANLLAADVGGTSCDISVVLDGRPWVENTFELEWDLVVNALSTEIVTLGAGGGSVVSVGPAGDLRVGPDSAGADPGPACYGRGGDRPTITDTALLAGILAPDRFLGGRMPLHPKLAEEAFARLDTPLGTSERIRFAWLIGINNVAEGIVDICIRHGIDPRDFSLAAFGAAGPMLLPSLLDLLPLASVIVPPNPGGFSALGMLSADQVFSDSRTMYGVLDADAAPRVAALFESMEVDLVARAGGDRPGLEVSRSFDARLVGQGWETPFVPAPGGPVDADTMARMVESFHDHYRRRNGQAFSAMPVEGVTYRVQVSVPSEKVRYRPLGRRHEGRAEPVSVGTIRHLHDEPVEVACYERASLFPGDQLEGPTLVWEENSTTYVPLGRRGVVGEHGEIVIT
jgi:N-methylhydantoinase A